MIGSDTAFFVRNTPQLCTGRGEVMSPIELPLQGKYLAIAKPEEGVSTKEAYSGVKPAVPAVRLAEAPCRRAALLRYFCAHFQLAIQANNWIWRK